MTKKETAIAFLQLAAMGKTDEAYEKYIAPGFIHHNQYYKGDRQSLKMAMTEAHKRSPNRSFEVKQAFEDGNTVITHSRVTRQNSDDPEIAVVHIFRFEGDQVAELWDLGQLIDKNSPNQNGPF